MRKIDLVVAAHKAVWAVAFGPVVVNGVEYLITPHYHYYGLKLSVCKSGDIHDNISININSVDYTASRHFTGDCAKSVYIAVMMELETEQEER